MSWISYPPSCEFPIQNLPYGVFYVIARNETPANARPGVAIGDYVLDLSSLERNGFFTSILEKPTFHQPSLNPFMSLGRPTWIKVRNFLQQLLSPDNPTLRDNPSLRNESLFKLKDIANLLPVSIGDYTDFYSSKEHASNMGRIFRPNEEPLKPNWLWMPIGYHGRASSIVVSGEPIRRPLGQIKPPNGPPVYGRCAKLDLELEMAFFVGGPGNALGDPISIKNAEEHMFGMVLMNDWSARDIQAWEYVPLGPFGGKNFATTISPWIVTFEALEPFRVQGPTQDPPPLPYLKSDKPAAYDINLFVHINTKNSKQPVQISHSNFKYMYWSMTQQLTHHSVTGCNMRAGDLLGSGTISGPDPTEWGSLMELSWNGKNPISLPEGETRSFFEDGDTCILRGWAQGEGYRIGFGECKGEILPSIPLDSKL